MGPDASCFAASAGFAVFRLVSLFCQILLLSQLLFYPEVLAGDHLTDARGLPPRGAPQAAPGPARRARALGPRRRWCPHCALSVLLAQLCEADPRSRVSQLVCLQCKLSVSRYGPHRGFMTTHAPSTLTPLPTSHLLPGAAPGQLPAAWRGPSGPCPDVPRSCSWASNSELSPSAPPFGSLSSHLPSVRVPSPWCLE